MDDVQSKRQSIRNTIKPGTPERDWPDPHPPTDEEFEEFCRDFEIGPEQADDVLVEIYWIILIINKARAIMREEARVSDIRREFEKQANRLTGVIEYLDHFNKYLAYKNRPGSEFYAHPHAISAVERAATEHLSPLIDPWYLCGRIGAVPSGPSYRPSEVQFDYQSGRDWVNRYTEPNPTRLIATVLEAARETMVQAAGTMKVETRKGGRDRYWIALWALVYSAEIYHQLGHHPQNDNRGPFCNFAKSLFGTIGWHTTWVDANIQKAVTGWSIHREKTNPA